MGVLLFTHISKKPHAHFWNETFFRLKHRSKGVLFGLFGVIQIHTRETENHRLYNISFKFAEIIRRVLVIKTSVAERKKQRNYQSHVPCVSCLI